MQDHFLWAILWATHLFDVYLCYNGPMSSSNIKTVIDRGFLPTVWDMNMRFGFRESFPVFPVFPSSVPCWYPGVSKAYDTAEEKVAHIPLEPEWLCETGLARASGNAGCRTMRSCSLKASSANSVPKLGQHCRRLGLACGNGKLTLNPQTSACAV